MKNLDVKTLNMLENIFVSFGIVILLMDDQLFQLMLKSIMILYFQIFKKQHGNGLIATHKFANTLLIYANVRIEVAVDHHEQLALLNFYHYTMAFFLLLYKVGISI